MESSNKDNSASDVHSQGPEASLNVMAAFTTVHQRCHITAITMPKSTAWCMIQHTAVGICNIHLPLDQEIAMVITYRTTLKSEQLIYQNFPYDQYQKEHYPNLAFNHQVTAPINQLGPVVSEASPLALVMVEQPIIQVAISSVEMIDGTKSKFESWIASVENATQIWPVVKNTSHIWHCSNPCRRFKPLHYSIWPKP